MLWCGGSSQAGAALVSAGCTCGVLHKHRVTEKQFYPILHMRIYSPQGGCRPGPGSGQHGPQSLTGPSQRGHPIHSFWTQMTRPLGNTNFLSKCVCKNIKALSPGVRAPADPSVHT